MSMSAHNWKESSMIHAVACVILWEGSAALWAVNDSWDGWLVEYLRDFWACSHPISTCLGSSLTLLPLCTLGGIRCRLKSLGSLPQMLEPSLSSWLLSLVWSNTTVTPVGIWGVDWKREERSVFVSCLSPCLSNELQLFFFFYENKWTDVSSLTATADFYWICLSWTVWTFSGEFFVLFCFFKGKSKLIIMSLSFYVRLFLMPSEHKYLLFISQEARERNSSWAGGHSTSVHSCLLRGLF